MLCFFHVINIIVVCAICRLSWNSANAILVDPIRADKLGSKKRGGIEKGERERERKKCGVCDANRLMLLLNNETKMYCRDFIKTSGDCFVKQQMRVRKLYTNSYPHSSLFHKKDQFLSCDIFIFFKCIQNK